MKQRSEPVAKPKVHQAAKTLEDVPAKYDRVLDRLIERLDDSGVKTWEFVEQQVDEAIALEQAAEELTRDEALLISAYVRRDLKSIGLTVQEIGTTLANWLRFDLTLLEQSVVERLLAVADRSRIDYELLREQLDHADSQYLAGEITVAGTLRCLQCGSKQRLHQTSTIVPCSDCSGLVFERPVPTRVD